MSITDSNGNFSEDFLKRLEDLKKDQKENLRELERLRIDAYLEVLKISYFLIMKTFSMSMSTKRIYLVTLHESESN